MTSNETKLSPTAATDAPRLMLNGFDLIECEERQPEGARAIDPAGRKAYLPPVPSPDGPPDLPPPKLICQLRELAPISSLLAQPQPETEANYPPYTPFSLRGRDRITAAQLGVVIAGGDPNSPWLREARLDLMENLARGAVRNLINDLQNGKIYPLRRGYDKVGNRDLSSDIIDVNDADDFVRRIGESGRWAELWAEREKAGGLVAPSEPALPPPSPIVVEQPNRRRGHYITFLEPFMLALPEEAAGWSVRVITDKFAVEWPSLGGEGKLPHKRYVDAQVENLRKKFKKRRNNPQ
jgi:hypothetical protein